MKYLHPQSFTQESGRLSSFLALTILLLLQGCAERPSTQIDGVRQSIEDARLAGAQNYAFELLEQAETSYRLALDELNQQDERLALWRSYSKVREILALAHSQAEEAKSAALANLEETKSNAQMAHSQARQQIVQAQAFLDHPLSP